MLLNIADHDSGFVLLKCVGTLALNMVIKGMSDLYNTVLMMILRSPNHRFLSIIQQIVCDDGGRNGRCWGRRGESKENDVVGCCFLFYRSRQTFLLLSEDDDVERYRRAHMNDLENVPIFILIAMFYLASNPSPFWANCHLVTFTASRCLHTVAYVGLKSSGLRCGDAFSVRTLLSIL